MLSTLLIKNYILKDSKPLNKLKKLQNLIIDGNIIFNFDFLQSLNLKLLQVQGNILSNNDKYSISQQIELKNLYLDDCGFIEVYKLQDLTQLRELTLKNSQLKNSDLVDCSFRLLQKLDVSHNELKSLDNLTLSPCLFELNVSHNKIGKLFYDDVSTNAKIEVLDLSYNKLFDISQLTLFPSLKDLNLESNKLGEKRVQVLKTLQIQTLNLTNIQCRTLNCINTNYLTNINIYNYLENFDATMIFKCQNLEYYFINSFVLQNNQIQHLEIKQQNYKIRSRYQIYSKTCTNNLLNYLKNRTHDPELVEFNKLIAQVNVILALNKKEGGYEQRIQKEQICYQFQNIIQIYRSKYKQLQELTKQFQSCEYQLNIYGFE
ncbi:Conserved_hypothetical protein [Hexamita inflata]|uniref:Uncharacterized protein n=1 Tax=Hexamita inflata TaxID=28002 RepID=A0AA86NTJ4_9EUKA|nr:Conserved hypothetical protein [Hexamita inflata]